MLLSRFPRIRLGHLDTPLEPLDRLSRHLGGPKLWIKRDDCTGLATGGNKTRKLEFLMAEASAQGARHIVTHGATQSNHVRQTAAACARLGLQCTALLERRVKPQSLEYANSGNVFLDRLFGAHLEVREAGLDMNAEVERHVAALLASGEAAFGIPGGGSNATGALGYVLCAQEIVTQANALGLVVDQVVNATGSAGTQAGLVAGLWAMNSGIDVLGIGVRAPRETQEKNVHRLAAAVCAKLGIDAPLPEDRVRANCDYVGGGYGVPTAAMQEAVTLLARLEGILLDPVYSGKGMAGLIDLIRQGRYTPEQNIVFVHTGGAVGLYGYREVFDDEHAKPEAA